MSAFGWIALGAIVVFVIALVMGRSAAKKINLDEAGGCYAIATIALTVMVVSGALTIFI
jgi:hypothetical protein